MTGYDRVIAKAPRFCLCLLAQVKLVSAERSLVLVLLRLAAVSMSQVGSTSRQSTKVGAGRNSSFSPSSLNVAEKELAPAIIVS